MFSVMFSFYVQCLLFLCSQILLVQLNFQRLMIILSSSMIILLLLLVVQSVFRNLVSLMKSCYYICPLLPYLYTHTGVIKFYYVIIIIIIINIIIIIIIVSRKIFIFIHILITILSIEINLQKKLFSFELDKFLELIPDLPKMPNYVTASGSNSILDQLTHLRAQGIYRSGGVPDSATEQS